MDRYNRVWRDPKSPLTPLTPRPTQVFDFDRKASPSTAFGHKTAKLDNFLGVSGRSQATTRRLAGYNQARKTKHFSQDFKRIRSVFSPNAQNTASETTPKIVKQESREFKHSSRIRTVFSLVTLAVLWAFGRVSLEDLESLGVRGAKELMLALNVIKFAKRFFK